jgi:hypothetical protein
MTADEPSVEQWDLAVDETTALSVKSSETG